MTSTSRPVRHAAVVLQRWLLYVGLVAGALFAAAPVIWMLSSSFKSNTAIFAFPPKLVDDTFSFDAFASVLTTPAILGYFANSYLVAAAVTVATAVVSILTAYALSRFEFRGKRVFQSMVIGVQAVPPITLLIPFFGIVATLGLYDTYQGLILSHVVITLPYSIVMMTAYFNGLPVELDEAAKIDGAGATRTLWQILVPVATPGIAAVAIYTFMVSWNEYLFALSLTRADSRRTIPVGIQMLMSQYNIQWQEIMAVSILGSLPVLLLFIVFQRYFIGGLAAGAVK